MTKINLTEKRLIAEMVFTYILLVFFLILVCLVSVKVGGANGYRLKIHEILLLWFVCLFIVIIWNIFSSQFGFYAVLDEAGIQLRKFRSVYREYKSTCILRFGIYRFKHFSAPCIIVSDSLNVREDEIIVTEKGYNRKSNFFVILLNDESWAAISSWYHKEIDLPLDNEWRDYSDKEAVDYYQRISVYNNAIEE